MFLEGFFMNIIFVFLLAVMLLPGVNLKASEADRIRQLNLEGTTYTPGGEPAPIIILVPRGTNALEHVGSALEAFFDGVPHSLRKAVSASNEITAAIYSPDVLLKVAVGRDDCRRYLKALNKKK